MKSLIKSTSVILALIMLLGMFCAFPMTAGALDPDEFLCTSKTDGTVIINEYFGSDADLVIPSKLNGKTVSAIDDYAFYNNKSIKSVTIPDTVTEIGYGAF